MRKKRKGKSPKSATKNRRDSATGKFVNQNPSKGSVWSGLSNRKTVNLERNLRGVMKEHRGEFLSKEIARYKGIRIIED